MQCILIEIMINISYWIFEDFLYFYTLPVLDISLMRSHEKSICPGDQGALEVRSV